MTKIYMKTSGDKYDLPVAIANTTRDLAKLTGDAEQTIKSGISNGVKFYHRIIIDDKD